VFAKTNKEQAFSYDDVFRQMRPSPGMVATANYFTMRVGVQLQNTGGVNTLLIE